jgi:hypothetical protein
VPEDPRPELDLALEALLRDLSVSLPVLCGLEASEILPVALSAHGAAAASVRSLDDVAREVRVAGARRRVELGLRPPFFLEGDPSRRLATLVHELLHLDPARPGQLLEHNRHAHRSHEEHEAQAEALARRYLETVDLTRVACLGHHGEVLMRHWRHRPVPGAEQRRFGEAELFIAPVLMRTPRASRAVWW